MSSFPRAAQISVYDVCDHRAEWRVQSPCFQDRSENRWEARSHPFRESQTCGKDACLRHPAKKLAQRPGMWEDALKTEDRLNINAAVRRRRAAPAAENAAQRVRLAE